MHIRTSEDPILRQKCKPVKRVTGSIRRLLDDMVEAMYEAPGVGLAAPQIGIDKCVIVVDIGDELIELVNPEITNSSGTAISWEGCLSCPGIMGLVTRAEQITVRGLDRRGRDRWVDADGLLARVLQHEIDHVHGLLLLDRASEIVTEAELQAREQGRLKVGLAGTPEFAVKSFAAVHKNHDVRLVITQPDRPVGRGKKIGISPVKQWALEHDLPVFQPEGIDTDEVIERVKEAALDVLVVVAYGKIIPGRLLQIPTHGAINVHASLLPRYRGAAPIQWAILNGDEVSGVTTMWMDEGLDTGDIALKRECRIEPVETGGSLHDKLADIGAQLLAETLARIADGSCPRVPQGDDRASYARRLTSADERIDWSKQSVEIDRQVRALAPVPGAYTVMDGVRIKIKQGETVDKRDDVPPGTVTVAGEDLFVSCGDGAYRVLRLQRAGGRKVIAGEFIRGLSLNGVRWGCEE